MVEYLPSKHKGLSISDTWYLVVPQYHQPKTNKNKILF
jgi:hypothetical protein